MDSIRVLMVIPGEEPFVTRIVDKLSNWQNAVSQNGEDSLIEITYPLEDMDVCVVGNEEAKLKGHKPNRVLCGEIYAGNLIIAGFDEEGNFRNLSDSEIDKYTDELSLAKCGAREDAIKYIRYSIIGF